METGKSLKLYEYDLKTRQGLILQSENGFGEIAPLSGFSRETLKEARQEIIEVITKKKKPTLPSVRWGIFCAQRKLQSVHLPLCALGPKPGFNTAKLKLGSLSVSEAVALVKQNQNTINPSPKQETRCVSEAQPDQSEAVRVSGANSRTIGPRERIDMAKPQPADCLLFGARVNNLRLDCNRAWTLAQALEFTSHFKPTDFLYIEEPVRTFEELIAFSEKTQFPIALDESIDSDWNAIPSLKAIVVKPTIVGEIPSVPPHLDLILSSSYESGLGLLHIANQAKSQLPIGLDTYRFLHDDLLINPIKCDNGFFSWSASEPLIDMRKLCPIAL